MIRKWRRVVGAFPHRRRGVNNNRGIERFAETTMSNRIGRLARTGEGDFRKKKKKNVRTPPCDSDNRLCRRVSVRRARDPSGPGAERTR